MIQAKLPDGTVLRFPAGTPDEVINRTVQQQLGAAQPQASRVAREVVGGIAGLGEGLGQFTRGAIQAAADLGAAAGLPTEGIRSAVAREQAAQEQKFEEQFGDAIAPQVTQVVGQAIPAIALPASRALSLGGQAAAGATGGALASAVQPQAELMTPQEALAERGTDALIGGAIGGVAAPLTAAAIGGGQRAVRGVRDFVSRKTPTQSTVQPLLGDVAGGIDDVGRLEQTRNILGNEAAKLNKRVSDAFTLADETSIATPTTVRGAGNLYNQLLRKSEESLDDSARVIYRNAAERVRSLGDDANIRDLQGLRRSATKASAGGGSQGFAAGDVKGTIDRFLDESLEAGDVVGSPQNVKQWKDAIALRAEFGRRFENPRVVARAIDEGETTERIGQQLFGGGSVSNARDAAKSFDSVLKAAGAENRAEAQSLLKQSVVHKMFNQASGRSGDSATPEIWTRGLANEIQKLRQRNPSLFKKFTKQEQAQLNQLEKLLRKQEEPALINRALDVGLGIMNKNPLLDVQLPTPFAPQTNISVDDAIGLLSLNPRSDNISEIVRAISGVTGTGAALEATE